MRIEPARYFDAAASAARAFLSIRVSAGAASSSGLRCRHCSSIPRPIGRSAV
jgi:hypothetical protein